MQLLLFSPSSILFSVFTAFCISSLVGVVTSTFLFFYIDNIESNIPHGCFFLFKLSHFSFILGNLSSNFNAISFPHSGGFFSVIANISRAGILDLFIASNIFLASSTVWVSVITGTHCLSLLVALELIRSIRLSILSSGSFLLCNTIIFCTNEHILSDATTFIIFLLASSFEFYIGWHFFG